MIRISEDSEGIAGTTADLVAGDYLSLWELLHALMLPSGNDAAFALAEYFGTKLIEEKEKLKEEWEF